MPYVDHKYDTVAYVLRIYWWYNDERKSIDDKAMGENTFAWIEICTVGLTFLKMHPK